jgi:2'-5' RNA ligase
MTRTTYIALPVAHAILGSARIPAECLKAEPHLTLHHLGGTPKDETVAAIVEAVRAAARGLAPIRAELTGLGTFIHAPQVQTPVVLVNSRDACRLWHRLDGFLAGAGVRLGAQYGFQPHVTLETMRTAMGGTAWARDFRPHRFIVSEILVITKDKTKQQKQVERIPLGDESSMNEDSISMRNAAHLAHERLDTSDVE